jgi:hypothetical protein
VKPLLLAEIVDRERYQAIRPAYRDALIAHKRDRRLALGDRVTLVFEDRETLRFQVQEMIWVERTVDAEKIQHELDVYNELMPNRGDLSATLFIEITDLAEIRPELERLVGLDERLMLDLGDGGSIAARFDPKQLEEDRLAAVQYVKFVFDDEQARRFTDAGTEAVMRIDHPNYSCAVPIPAPIRQRLIDDLVGEPEPLITPGGTAPRETVLSESEGVRVLRPAHPRVPGHQVVEPLQAGVTLLDADPDLLQALAAAVQRAAREVCQEHGACRVQADAGPGEPTLRWHVLPVPGKPVA